jgi:hypothetical protein
MIKKENLQGKAADTTKSTAGAELQIRQCDIIVMVANFSEEVKEDQADNYKETMNLATIRER